MSSRGCRAHALTSAHADTSVCVYICVHTRATRADSEYLVFEGISVDEKGEQHYLDATLAYKRAVLNCIKYLSQFGYTEVRLCREYGACCRRCLEVRRRRRPWLNGERAVSRVISRDLV